MQIGICADPATLARLPTPLPFDYVEGHVQNFLKPEAADAEFSLNAAALRNCPCSMPVANNFLPADLKVTGPKIDYPRLDRYAATAFRRASEVGMSTIVFGSGAARAVPQDFSTAQAYEQFVDILRHLAPLAAAQGVTLVVEPLNREDCNFINTTLEGAEAVERAAHPNIRLLVDIFHLVRSGESPDDIIKVRHLAHHVHAAESKDQAASSVSAQDLQPFYRALKKIGYDARITLDATWTNLGEQAGPAVAALKAQWATAGQR